MAETHRNGCYTTIIKHCSIWTAVHAQTRQRARHRDWSGQGIVYCRCILYAETKRIHWRTEWHEGWNGSLTLLVSRAVGLCVQTLVERKHHGNHVQHQHHHKDAVPMVNMIMMVCSESCRQDNGGGLSFVWDDQHHKPPPLLNIVL